MKGVNICPYCAHPVVKLSVRPEVGDTDQIATRTAECQKCKRKWTVNYRVCGFTESA